jgi:seryl-tRNA synthetase
MLSIDYIRENKQKVLDALKNKNREADIDGILALDEERREKIQEAQVLREERNKLAKQKFTEESKKRGKEIKDLLKNLKLFKLNLKHLL